MDFWETLGYCVFGIVLWAYLLWLTGKTIGLAKRLLKKWQEKRGECEK